MQKKIPHATRYKKYIEDYGQTYVAICHYVNLAESFLLQIHISHGQKSLLSSLTRTRTIIRKFFHKRVKSAFNMNVVCKQADTFEHKVT